MERRTYFSLSEMIGYFLFIMIGLNIIVAIPLIIKMYPAIVDNLDKMDDSLEALNFFVDDILLANIVWQILGLVTLYIVFARKKINIKEYFQLKQNLDIKNWLLVILLFILLALSLSPVSDYFEVPPNPTMKYLMDNGNIIFIIFTAIIAAPILEEIIFRGWLFNEIETKYGQFAAFNITSILFTIIHIQYNLSEMILVLVIAYSLAYIRLRTQNIIFPIALHLLNNTGAFIEFLTNN